MTQSVDPSRGKVAAEPAWRQSLEKAGRLTLTVAAPLQRSASCASYSIATSSSRTDDLPWRASLDSTRGQDAEVPAWRESVVAARASRIAALAGTDRAGPARLRTLPATFDAAGFPFPSGKVFTVSRAAAEPPEARTVEVIEFDSGCAFCVEVQLRSSTFPEIS